MLFTSPAQSMLLRLTCSSEPYHFVPTPFIHLPVFLACSHPQSALIIKTLRIQLIFSQEKLAVKHLPDSLLFKLIGCPLVIELIIIIVFITLNASPAVLEEYSKGVGQVVYGCQTDTTEYTVWVVVHITYLAVFVFVGAIMAFRVRNVPADFNESTHIVSCVYLFIIMGVVLIPVDLNSTGNPSGEPLYVYVAVSIHIDKVISRQLSTRQCYWLFCTRTCLCLVSLFADIPLPSHAHKHVRIGPAIMTTAPSPAVTSFRIIGAACCCNSSIVSQTRETDYRTALYHGGPASLSWWLCF